MPESNPEGGAVASSLVASAGAGSTTLVEKDIAALPPKLAKQAKDPKRKARSQDPG
jgi:hypothetical protein